MILGTVQLGMDYGVANSAGKPTTAEAHRMLEYAEANGVRILDTAEGYGNAESIIASYLQDHPNAFECHTKLPASFNADSCDVVVDAVAQRCRALGLAQLGCIYLHRYDQCENPLIVQGLQSAKRNGLTQQVGVSIYDPHELRFIVDNLKDKIDVVQLPLNVLSVSRWHEEIEEAVQNGIVIYARSLFLQGLLLMEDDMAIRRLGATEALSAVRSMASSQGQTTEEFCYQTIREYPGISDVVVGCDDLEQLKRNIDLERNASIEQERTLNAMTFPDVDSIVVNPSLWHMRGVKKRVVGLLQVRMDSARLPGKAFIDIGAETMIERIVKRIERSTLLDGLILCTSDEKSDDPLGRYCETRQIKHFRGSKLDVLDRMYRCAEAERADVVVRLTGDNPFIDPDIIDAAIASFFSRGNLDYLLYKQGLPLGMKVEVFSFVALAKAARDAHDDECREHVTLYIYRNPGIFKCEEEEIGDDPDCSDIRLTIDTEEDLQAARILFSQLPESYNYKDLIALVRAQESELPNRRVAQKEVHYSGSKRYVDGLMKAVLRC